jgi:GH18 family chitinase
LRSSCRTRRYDDEESVAIKASYARELGLAGMMWWEASEEQRPGGEAVLLAAANAAWGAGAPQ